MGGVSASCMGLQASNKPLKYIGKSSYVWLVDNESLTFRKSRITASSDVLLVNNAFVVSEQVSTVNHEPKVFVIWRS
jgi:hypothetical protein